MQNAPDSDRSYHTLNRKPTIPRCASRRSKVGRIAEKRTLCLWSLDPNDRLRIDAREHFLSAQRHSRTAGLVLSEFAASGGLALLSSI